MASGDKGINIDWTKILVAFITATITLAGTLGTVYLRHKLTEKKDPIVQRLKSGERLNAELDKILERSDASRVTVAQFHNGSKLASGHEYEKISTTHQVVGPGVSRSKKRIADLPITLFDDVLLKVDKQHVVFYDNASEIPNVGSIFREEGVMSLYILELESVEGRYAGVMFIEYNSETEKLGEKEIRSLREEARAVGAYLSR